MGNRAVITQACTGDAPCIYLHWNGGRASVNAFLAVARARGVAGRGIEHIDALATICREYIGGSVYREVYRQADTDNGDNGVYLIDDKLRIIGRLFAPGQEETDPVKTAAIIEELSK